MAWYNNMDDFANVLGISSKSLNLNTAETKAKREAEAKQRALDEIKRKQLEEQSKADAESYGVLGTPELSPEYSYRTPSINQPQVQQPSGPSFGERAGQFFQGNGGTLLSAALPVAGGALGYLATKGDTQQRINESRDIANRLGQANTVSDTEYRGVQDDAGQLAMRQQALQGMQQRAAMGFTPEEQAQLNQLRNQTNAQFGARQAQIQDDMARRGMTNSGMNLAAQMSNNQAQTQQAAQQADQTAAMSFAAKQNALSNLGNMASNALSSDYNRQMGKAQNINAVNQFNAQAQTAAKAAQARQQNATLNQQEAQSQAKGGMISGLAQGAGNIINAYKQSKK